MDNKQNDYEIIVDLKEALNFAESEIFNDFLLNNTTISIGLLISEILGQTLRYMMQDIENE